MTTDQLYNQHMDERDTALEQILDIILEDIQERLEDRETPQLKLVVAGSPELSPFFGPEF